MKKPNWTAQLEQRAGTYSNDHDRVLADGTRCIGHLTRHRFIHLIHPPLTTAEFIHLQENLGQSIPPQLAGFYAHHNGLTLFQDELSIYGLRRSYSRQVENALAEPYDLISANQRDRAAYLDPQLIAFAFCSAGNGSIIAMAHSQPEVVKLTREGKKVLATWPSLGDCILDEFDRLKAWWDSGGREESQRFLDRT